MPIVIEGAVPLIQVFDMPTSIRFYRDLLGFEVVATSGDGDGDDVGWAWLRHGPAELMLNTIHERGRRPQAPDPARALGHSDTGLFLGCRDLDGAYAHLRERGVDVAPPVVRPYGMRQLSFRDPDGYGICLQWRAGEEPARPGST